MTPSPASAIVRTRPLRILVRGVNWIGDAVMTMPAIHRLRQHHPDAHITFLCPRKLHDLWRHNPHINQLLDPADSAALRQTTHDLALLLPNSFRSAWEAWRAGIPRRVGFAGHSRRWLLTDIVNEPRNEQVRKKNITVAGKTFRIKEFLSTRHQVHRYLDLISYLGGNRDYLQPKIWLAPGELPSLTKFLHEGSRPFLGIHAGAEYGPAKRWPAERFAQAAQQIAEQFPCRWLIFGGPGETVIAHQIQKQLQAATNDPRSIINVAGKTTLLELCELISICKLLITNDTGPMHLATALNTPVLAIFGSTSAELTGPLGPKVRIVQEKVECSPCFLRECPIDFRCMNRIPVEQVTAAALKLLEK
jgi:heptosyltransferase II